jgi:hypothetical protein
VEIGRRKPLPFTRRAQQVSEFRNETTALAGLVTQPATTAAAFAAAARFLAVSASPTGLAALRGERQAPPRLGTLGEGLDTTPGTTVPDVGERPPGKVYDHVVDAPVAVALLPGATVDLSTTPPAARRRRSRTPRVLWRAEPPTTASVDEARSRSIAARLVLAEPAARPWGARRPAPGHGHRRRPRAGDGRGARRVRRRPHRRRRRRRAPRRLHRGAHRRAAGRRGTPGAVLAAGESAVLALPNARADAGDGDRPRLRVTGDPVRLVVLAHGGAVLADEVVGDGGELEVAQGAERIVAVGQGHPPCRERPPGRRSGLAGWHAGSVLPYAGSSAAVGPGCVVRALGEPLAPAPERAGTGWVLGAELARGLSTVATRFPAADRVAGRLVRAASSSSSTTRRCSATRPAGAAWSSAWTARRGRRRGRRRAGAAAAVGREPQRRGVRRRARRRAGDRHRRDRARLGAGRRPRRHRARGRRAGAGRCPGARRGAAAAGRRHRRQQPLTWLGESRSPRERRLARELATGRAPSRTSRAAGPRERRRR